MSCKSLVRSPIPLRVRRPPIDDSVNDDDIVGNELVNYNHNQNQNQSGSVSRDREKELQIVSMYTSTFTLPPGWLVERKPRLHNPSIVDKSYYEPGTGRKFRSLLAVQRYLAEEASDYHSTERIIPKDDDTTYIEPGTGQRYRSLRAVERYTRGENSCTSTSKPAMKKSGKGKQRVRGVRSYEKRDKKRSSVAEEDKITLKALKHSIKSKKSDSWNTSTSEMDNRACVHDLTEPPAKVSWVLSGPGGFWNPFVDDSAISESEKLKWSEAFVLSIHE